MAWMIIRVRGSIHARRDIVETLERLNLSRPNHATVVPEAPTYHGMIIKVQGYVTWGEAEAETLTLLVQERGRPPAGAPPSAPESTASASSSETASVVATVLERGLGAAQGLRPLFRLHAPKGGWRSTKKPFASGGALGYRGRTINDLARKML
ncbi:MAG: 50S ribosomal protein L30 [Thermoplasmata archaeon]|nr:50S ribosomal protein L30 [Thermoplasmata archaeon]MCI4359086.1 50S ribosomal protein L30 [Thermoplasmata archaeon]